MHFIQSSDLATKLSDATIEGGAISGHSTGIYTIVNPADGWGTGYYLIISSIGSQIALNLNTGVLKYRASGGNWVSLAN